jgi:hypothetical protein
MSNGKLVANFAAGLINLQENYILESFSEVKARLGEVYLVSSALCVEALLRGKAM